MSVVLAIDADTTGVRTRAVFSDGSPSVASYREFPQYFPRPGWVEHNPTEIWDAVHHTLCEVIQQLHEPVSAIGITNQRETVVAWNKNTGQPYGKAIVWQDRRTAEMCEKLQPHLHDIRNTTGLVLDPYFSASKIAWLLDHQIAPRDSELAVGTIDSWLIWQLTNGTSFVTDPSNASRTMLFDITQLSWSDDMCELFNIPRGALAEVAPSSGRVGTTRNVQGVPDHIPISGIAGDQQAALFGQACTQVGMAKNTYGTGSFVLMNVGATCPEIRDGMLTTIAWQINETTTYAYEGAIFITGAAVQWLRDGLQIIDDAHDVQTLAQSVPDSDGVFFVPSFTGLGSPWWDPYARGTIIGITRGTTKAHIARAVIDAMVFQTKDVVDAMIGASGVPLAELRVDGGAASMDFMLQLQADALRVPVLRPDISESTAMGAAYLAGLGENVWSSVQEITDAWKLDQQFTPSADDSYNNMHKQWLRAVSRSRDWLR